MTARKARCDICFYKKNPDMVKYIDSIDVNLYGMCDKHAEEFARKLHKACNNPIPPISHPSRFGLMGCLLGIILWIIGK